MRIKQFSLKNFRGFSDLSISFEDSARHEQPSKTLIFIGDNGAGKTSILDALALSLSWVVARICRSKGSGRPIADMDVQNEQSFAAITLQLQYQATCYSWRLSKTFKGRLKTTDSQLDEINKLANLFREQLSQDAKNTALPLIVYYPVERAVLDIPLKIKTRHTFGQLDGYDSALQQGVDFKRFFEWFRECEDSENEVRAQKFAEILEKRRQTFPPQYTSFDDYMASLYGNDYADVMAELDFNTHEQIQAATKDPQLTAVRNAIKAFLSDFDNLRIQRKPKLQMLVNKNGKTLNVAQLSQGEKSMIALVGDIARRLAIMNPTLKNPLQGYGIILIDEIDLHLHPKWQRTVVGNLKKTFPNCQFVLTTHSPIVISESPDLLCYALNDGELHKVNNLYGMDVNQVLLQDMDAAIRNADIQEVFDNLRDNLQEGQLAEAKALLADLEKKISTDNLELSKARLLIKRLEAQRALNR